MSLADYLAKNYLTASNPTEKDRRSKKRKRKGTSSALDSATQGLTIADDEPDWSSRRHTGGGGSDDEDAGPTVLGYVPKESKKSAWKRIGTSAPSNKEQEAADAILAAAAKENDAAVREAEDAPVVEDVEGVGGSDALVGLRTGAEVSAHIRKTKEAERRRYEESSGGAGKASETIYRDASGRIINVAMKRAEARKKAEEEEAKKREQEEAAKGDVQREQKAQRQQALADAKYLTVARGADDVELNEEMKEVERWNDPAMQFLRPKRAGVSKSGRPLYKGAFDPNRYGIRPGYRWDGVDRGNGFEKKWFAARNRQKDRRELEYAWQMDD